MLASSTSVSPSRPAWSWRASFRASAQATLRGDSDVARSHGGALVALLSGAPTNDLGAFVRAAVLEPGAWLLGFAVLRGAVQAEPGAGYETERVFSFGIPALVVFWLMATWSRSDQDAGIYRPAFAASLSFVGAGSAWHSVWVASGISMSTLSTAPRVDAGCCSWSGSSVSCW